MKQEKTKIATSYQLMHFSCKCKRWLTGACAGRVARASRMEEEGCRRKKRMRTEGKEGRERRENGRMVVEALSTGSLGHSYASAVGTITAKPRLLHKMLCACPFTNTNIGIDTCESAFESIVQRHRIACQCKKKKMI